MVSVATKVNIWCLVIISEKHVLGVIVHQVVLLGGDGQLSHETSNSEFLNDGADVELAVEACAGLALELVLVRVLVLAAEAPRARHVLLSEESPHGVPERSASVTHLMQEVVSEVSVILRGVGLGGALIFLRVNIVV